MFSCAPRVTTTISKSYSPVDYREDIRVLGLQDPLPTKFDVLGTVKIGDTGFSTNCGWDVVVENAKMEARKAGGNAIKIVQHTPPSIMGSSCHQIAANILRVENFDAAPATSTIDTALANAGYALLHVYRPSGAGSLVSYDLHLGDTVICRVSNRWRKTIWVRKDGMNTLWARTETKENLPINITIGKEYYIRCGIQMGAFVGRPKLEAVDSQLGKLEYQTVRLREADKRDVLILKNGQEVECRITGEDGEFVYITYLKDGEEIATQASKSQIRSIERCE